jgi:hypothetical protein
MIQRTFAPEDLVVLPRLNAHQALALASALVAAAGHGSLPDFLHSMHNRLVERTNDLRAVLGPKVVASRPDQKAADFAEDNAVNALEEVMHGWGRLPDSVAGASELRAAHARLFGTGMSFLTLKYKEEWAQVEARLDMIQRESIDQLLASIGATPVLANLIAAHEAYGKAIGITATSIPVEDPKVRAALDTVVAALRAYVLRVAALADPEATSAADKDRNALVEKLLAPLQQWESDPIAAAATTPPAPPPATGTPAAK